MPWTAIKFNNGGVITDDAVYFKICTDQLSAQAMFDKWKKARDERLPVPSFTLTQMNARQLTGDARLPAGNCWGLSTTKVTGTFYQLSKTNKVASAATVINGYGDDDRRRVRGALVYGQDLHLADTQFFLTAARTIRFIDIDFRANNNDVNLADLIGLINP